MEYEYTKKNLLNSPEKYQMSPFRNVDFLKAYKKSRLSTLKLFENHNKINTFQEILEKTSINEENDCYKNNQNNCINTNKLLKFLYIDILKNYNNDKLSLEILIKKFEIKKKIFESYDLEFKENTKKFINQNNYILLSLICLLKYEKTNNLKFLNVSLKLNDTISSQIKKLKISEDIFIFYFVIKKELEIIFTICNKKGVVNE